MEKQPTIEKYFTIADKIDFKTTDDLLAVLETLNKNDTLHLYLSSTGGYILSMFTIIDAINHKIKNGLKVRLVAVSHIFSAAFNMFFLINTLDKKLISCVGMIHTATTYFDAREIVKNTESYREHKKMLKELNLNFFEYYKKLGFTRNDLNSFKRGKDNFVDMKKLETFLKNNLELIKNNQNYL